MLQTIRVRQLEDKPLLEVVEYGWRLIAWCKVCGRGGSWDSGQILQQFGRSILSPAGQVADRLRCHDCGQLGAWIDTRQDVSPWMAEGGQDSGLSEEQARKRRLRKLLSYFRLDPSLAGGPIPPPKQRGDTGTAQTGR